VCIRDVAGHCGEAKEGVCREGDVFNEEAIGPVVPWREVMLDDEEIGKEYELTSFVLDFDLEEEQSTTINEGV
jgi:hypothetical protein